jgi:hypothetical protein
MGQWRFGRNAAGPASCGKLELAAMIVNATALAARRWKVAQH